jgi:hypothetical protein
MALPPDDSAANWPEAPTYSYSGLEAHLGLLFGGGLMTGGLFGLAMAGLNAVSKGLTAGSIPLVALVALFIIAGFWSTWFIPRSRPAIALSAEGVFAYLKGKPWRYIRWREMVSITRSSFIYRGLHGHSLSIKGPRYTIQVASTIDHYTDLCECLTRYSRDHRVPLRASEDRSKESDISEL